MAIDLDFGNVLSSLGSLFEGPKKGEGQPRDNIFDRMAKDFDSPLLADLFGAKAQVANEQKMQEEKKKQKKIIASTGVDTSVNAESAGKQQIPLIQTDTGKKILAAILAGKPASSIFGGDS